VAVPQSNGLIIFLLVFCFAPPPRLIDPHFILHTSIACLSRLLHLGRFDYIFFPAGLWPTLTQTKVLARAYGRLFILRGESGGGHAPFSCAPFSSQAPPAPPYACSGAR